MSVQQLNLPLISFDFKKQFVPWRGIYSLMQGGWRQLPIKVQDFKWENYGEFKDILHTELENALIKYKINEVVNFSILCDNYITVKIK